MNGLHVHAFPESGDVTLTYVTYHGLVAWFTQTPHQVCMTPEEARTLLGRLFRFNLTWGLLTCGFVFILPLSVWSYFTQRRSISAQQTGEALGARTSQPAGDQAVAPHSESAPLAPGAPRSSFYQTVGWITAFLCVVFGINAIVCFFNGDFEPAVGGAFATAILGMVSWSWLGKQKP